MAYVFFNVRPGVAAHHRQALLDELTGRPDVGVAAAMRPDAKNELFRRMFYATVEDEQAAMNVLQHLEARPEIESVSFPADRFVAST